MNHFRLLGDATDVKAKVIEWLESDFENMII